MIEHYIETVVIYTIYIVEIIGVFIVTYTCIRGFIQYTINKLKLDDISIRIEIAKGLALGLEFKLAGEILRTILARTLSEIKVLAAIIILRIILTFVIHWEITSEIREEKQLRSNINYDKKTK